MTKLKLGAITEDKAVRITIDLPAQVHRDLVVYANALAEQNGSAAIDPSKLITPMLQRFMMTDRAFAKARRAGGAPSSG